MIIAAPPRPAGEFISLHKHWEVLDRVFDPFYDTLLKSDPVSAEDLCLAHSPEYVAAVLEGQAENGFGTVDSAVTEYARRSVTAMYSAAKAALYNGVAFAPVSGFHHAHYDYAQGYCTFNGLIVAARKLRAEGKAPRQVVIIDGDAHWGDGTDNIVNKLDLGDWLVNLDYRRVTPQFLRKLFADKPSLVLYQAGADAHEEDPFGAGYLNDREWRERDAFVFGLARRHQVPIAWNLAGGYNGEKTLSLHTSTFATAARTFFPEQHRLPALPGALSGTIAGLGH